ncbi:MAG: hypothetical protein HKN85_04265 [Gammaproteobacteria bacterium]|nr:hypothetical protein [Gammaproteobacteria bacterium]
MKKIFLSLAVPMILGACATSLSGPGFLACPGTANGPTDVTVTYRSGKTFMVSMKLKSNGHKNNQFRVKLKPKSGTGSKGYVVTTTGVSGTLPGGASTPFAWLNGSGSYNSTAADRHNIILCVPDVPVGTWYKFDVNVDGIGTIDPRLDVTN